MTDESEGDDCDEVNQEDSEQKEVDGMQMGADSTGKVMHNERAVSDL